MAHEGVPLVVIQRQLGTRQPGHTSIYLKGIDSSEIISHRARTAVADNFGQRRLPDEAIRAKRDRVGLASVGRPDVAPPAGD